jgi:hypothetical protein
MDLAEILELDGDVPGTARAIEEAVRLYGLKGNMVARALARSRLETLVLDPAH